MKKTFMRIFQIVIVCLLLGSSYSYAQNRIDRLEAVVDSLKHSSTGEVTNDTLITKDILRLANAKLILSKEYKYQYESYKKAFELQTLSNQLADSIIVKQKDALHNAVVTMNNMSVMLKDNNDKIRKLKNQRIILAGTSTVLALLVLVIL